MGSETHQYFINMKNAEDTLYRYENNANAYIRNASMHMISAKSCEKVSQHSDSAFSLDEGEFNKKTIIRCKIHVFYV